MKKVGLFIAILLFISNNFFGQVVTGAISSAPDGSNGNTDAIAGCDNGCDEQTLFTWFAPMSGNVCNGTSVAGSYASGHWPMQVSILIPSGCTVTVVAEYGGACNTATGAACDNTPAHCKDSRMDASVAGAFYDVVGINSGFNSPGTTTSGQAGAGNIGTCSFGIGGSGSTTAGYCLNGGVTNLNGTVGAPGCYVDNTSCGGTGAGGNADVVCTKSGLTNQSVTIWGMSDRADEIITYTVTPTAGTCTALGSVILPIEIIGLAAYRTNTNSISVNWSTATETNNKYFTVEYSLDGISFIPYTEVKGAGNSNSRKDYNCVFNEDVGSSKPYFRIKQVDYNGNFKYSTIVALGTSIGFLKTVSTIKAYYAPLTEKIITQFNLDAPSQITFSLYDITGTKSYELTQFFNEGDNEFNIPVPDKAGIYFLLYQNGSNLPVHKKIMVTK